jgi:long-chain acyl-CoA synthetase
MTKIMAPRFEVGEKFYDAAFYDLYKKLDYPDPWIEEGRNYSQNDSYSMMHPTWLHETIPATPDVSIYELLEKTIEKYPDEIAVIFFDKKTTYKELDTLIGKYAALLKTLGVKKGDAVAAILPNSLQHIVAFYGAAKIGAAHTPVNVMYQADEIAYQLKDSNVITLVMLDLLYGKVKDLHDE